MLGELFRAVLAAVLAAVTAVSFSPMPEPDAARVRKGPVVGADISWPNCPKGLGIRSRPTLGKPLPRDSARFVIIGLTNGPAFHANPCLASHVEYARERRMWASAYAVATYPTKKQLRQYGDAGPRSTDTKLGRLFNTGYAQAEINVAEMKAAGLDSAGIWVDVEPVTPPAPWTKRPRLNKMVVDGVLRIPDLVSIESHDLPPRMLHAMARTGAVLDRRTATRLRNRVDAGEMRGRLEMRLLQDAGDGGVSALAGRTAGAVGHRDESRIERLEPADGAPQRLLHRLRSRREELERHVDVA